MMNLFKYTLILVMLCASLLTQAQELTTFIIVRHAEKVADGTNDPLLSAVGIARADLFNDMMSSQKISAIYSTPYQRNLMTVNALAESKALSVVDMNHMIKTF